MSGAEQPPPEVPATLPGGERARVFGFTDGVLHLASERSHPPGQPLTVTLQFADAELTVQGKSAGSKRREDGAFHVRLRLHSLRREAREQLNAWFHATNQE